MPKPSSGLYSKRSLRILLAYLEAGSIPEFLTIARSPGTSLKLPLPSSPKLQRWSNEIESLPPEMLSSSETGYIIFWGEFIKLIILPPFPIDQSTYSETINPSPLRRLLDNEYTFGVILLRLGRYAVGVFKGDSLILSKTGTRYVKGRHKAGGTSQKRFQRIREKQIHEIFLKTCSIITEQFGQSNQDIDYIFLGGERHTLTSFRKICHYLENTTAQLLNRILPVNHPSLLSLERIPWEVWKTRIVIYQIPDWRLSESTSVDS